MQTVGGYGNQFAVEANMPLIRSMMPKRNQTRKTLLSKQELVKAHLVVVRLNPQVYESQCQHYKDHFTDPLSIPRD